MRVVGFFIYCFAAMTVPIGIGFGLMALRGPTYRVVEKNAAIEAGSFVSPESLFGGSATDLLADLRDEHPSSQAAAGAAFEDSTVAFFWAYTDSRSARNAASSLIDRLPISSQTSGPGGVRYTRSDDSQRGLVRTVGRFIVWLQGPNRVLVDSRFSALPSVERNPDTNIANTLVDENLALFITVILVWIVLQVFIWPRYASWAGTARAPAEKRAAAVNGNELITKLSAIEKTDGPVRVDRRRGDDELLVEWRYESGTWVSLMAAGGVTLVRRIRLRVDEKRHRVLARDEQSAVSWEASGDGATVATNFSWKAIRGIVFIQYERAAQFGVVLENGMPKFGEHYSFKFDVRELRAPVIAVLNDAGWDYRPVIAFNRLFGG
jgi:hypothetical protein